MIGYVGTDGYKDFNSAGLVVQLNSSADMSSLLRLLVHQLKHHRVFLNRVLHLDFRHATLLCNAYMPLTVH